VDDRDGFREMLNPSYELEEAAKFAPLDQLAVLPQCGFASTEEGNILTEEEQWAKLKLAVDVAKEVWGK
jgi:5-methyltetrahydropteroyltriglutamate--homocysteine methyltransferase